MKNIFLYSPYLHNFGGGEKYFATLVEILSNQNLVTILSTNKSVLKEQLENYFKVDLSKAYFISLKNISDVSRMTKECDIFICLSNFRYIQSYSDKRIQLLQIPYGKIHLATIIKKLFSFKIKEGIKDYYRLKLLHQCKNDDIVITNACFVHDVLKSNYQLDSKVLHPPIDDFYDQNIKKENIIISVGRIFSGLYNDKRYDIMIDAFRKLCDVEKHLWEYHIIGSLLNNQNSYDYFNFLQRKAEGLPIYFHTNVPYQELINFYNKATIFWHAAGYGIDENIEPEKVEHFGMTTVEAMSAGCIPIVINKGGQREIVTHGENGFLWNNTDELIYHTLQIIQIKTDTTNIINNARNRFHSFSKESFINKVQKLFSEYLE